MKGSNDVFIFEYYASRFVKNKDMPTSLDVETTWHKIRGEKMDPGAGLYFMRTNAKGWRNSLAWITNRNGPRIYVVGNGIATTAIKTCP